MNNKPIGLFDSGLGGLTVLSAVHELLPNEDIVYFGDSGRAPYGTKSKETIVKYTYQDINFLRKQDVKMIVIACNTASALSMPAAQEGYDIPIIEVIGPGARAAVKATRTGKIGVIGTPATVGSGVYAAAIQKLMPDCTCLQKACPLFVPLVEEGWWDSPIAALTAEEYLKEMREAGVDSLVMGCTHYPMLSGVIRKTMGDDVVLINSAREVALAVKEKLTEAGALHSESGAGKTRFYTSDSVEKFTQLAGLFLKGTVSDVERVEIYKESETP